MWVDLEDQQKWERKQWNRGERKRREHEKEKKKKGRLIKWQGSEQLTNRNEGKYRTIKKWKVASRHEVNLKYWNMLINLFPFH